MHYSDDERIMWLEDWHKSGISAWAYAKKNGLNPQTFVRWSKQGLEEKRSFVEVPARLLTPPRQPSHVTIEKGDVKIHIPLSEGCVELRTVMEALGGVL
jgi:hypothetical protein